MNIGQHIIFVGSQPKIFKTHGCANNFEIHYAVTDKKQNVEQLLTSLPLSDAPLHIVFLVIDNEFTELDKLLASIKEKLFRINREGKIIFIKSFIFVPLVDLLDIKKQIEFFQQILHNYSKLGVQKIYGLKVDFDELNKTKEDVLHILNKKIKIFYE